MYSCFYKNENAAKRISDAISRVLKGRIPVIMCLGSRELHYDSLGCRVGSLLADSPFTVYGTLENNIEAGKVQKALNFIRIMHPNNPILVIDSSLGLMSELGNISVKDEGITPGSINNLNLNNIGDLSITGVIATTSRWDFCISPAHMRKFSDGMAAVIADAVRELEII